MKMKWWKTALLGCLAVILIGCNPMKVPDTSETPLAPASDDLLGLEAPAATPTATPSDTQRFTPENQLEAINATQTPLIATLPFDSGLQSLIEMAKEDLSARLEVKLADIAVIDTRQVEWPDASLGCPQPDMAYSQVITPGYRITLEVGTILYSYHSDLDQEVEFCPQEMTLPVEPGEIKDGIPWVPVD